MEKGMADAYMAQAAGDAASSATRSVFFDRTMLTSKEVLLKIAEMVVCVIGTICVACASNPYVSQAGFFEFVASTGIIIAIILAVLYVFHLREKLAGLLRLNVVEMFYAGIWCFFFFAASTACVVHGSSYMYQEALIAAGFFGYIAMVLYGIDAFLMFHAWRTARTMTAEPTTQQVTTPAY
ncbi:plasmolipin-like [Pollicipes pollicipes]|uniref:plasmolipin-like n=1 Tax=Pollicipes pollicipes TaxID=41117 RepID=UPI0018851BB0|nr:plasmolipin-like [Pollicipes pollicipes]XP_037085765.1 plasmolipin-like [Pollicipes pollicipes]XP_037085766.1 plasmolipin-like [Pollicipes pollicipes]XP_037085795.1 plasmolipin-like [Pollicipes pollicipes]XP_037085797.1 plasmolipin-like [Pollicipes pollicipes]XP_037085798.1 plasmolipin-like [Pollicipes pollicipes]